MSTRRTTRQWSPSSIQAPSRPTRLSPKIMASHTGSYTVSPDKEQVLSSYIPENHRHLANSKYEDHLLFAYREFVLSWMNVDMMRIRGGGGGGGGSGGDGHWSDGDAIYRRLMDILFLRRCVSCFLPCERPMHIRLNKKIVVKNVKTLVYTLDQRHKERTGTTLSESIYNHVTHTTLPPFFAGLLKHDSSKGVKTRVAKYALTDLVSTVLPKYVPGLEDNRLYKALKPEILIFLAKGKSDISSLAAACTAYVIDRYLSEGFEMASIPCLVCKAFNRECQKIQRRRRNLAML